MHRCNQNSGHSVMVVHHVLVGYHCYNIGVMYKFLLVAISLDLATLVQQLSLTLQGKDTIQEGTMAAELAIQYLLRLG